MNLRHSVKVSKKETEIFREHMKDQGFEEFQEGSGFYYRKAGVLSEVYLWVDIYSSSKNSYHLFFRP